MSKRALYCIHLGVALLLGNIKIKLHFYPFIDTKMVVILGRNHGG